MIEWSMCINCHLNKDNVSHVVSFSATSSRNTPRIPWKEASFSVTYKIKQKQRMLQSLWCESNSA